MRALFRIRPLRTHAEYLEAEELQRDVWRFPDREVIPLNELVVAQKNGGLVLGAFTPAGRMAAFCFGIAGYRDGRAYHYSRMLGVRAPHQNTGLGLAMKKYQRRFVLGQGLPLIRWTFDPLQSRNAYFNLAKLGVVAREYAVNLYGPSGSRFNEGLDTDRFVVEWQIRSRRVEAILAGRARPPDPAPLLVEAVPRADGLPKPVRRPTRGPRLGIAIPREIDDLKGRDPELARRWRSATRPLFLSLFRRGFAVTGFAGGAYILEKP